MEKLAILYLVTKSNWGGAQRYVYDLTLEAKRAGYHPAVAAGGTGMLTERLAAHHIPTHTVPTLQRDISVYKEIKTFFALMRLLRTLRPAVLHVNSSKAGGIGALAARLCGTPRIIFTVHGLPQREARPWVIQRIIGFLTWLTAFFSHRVITITKEDTATLSRQPFMHNRVLYIPNGIEHHGLDRDAARAVIYRHLDTSVHERIDNAHWIGTVAELTHNKAHHYALEAMRTVVTAHPEIVYVIVGDGELREQYEQYVSTHNLTDHVFFTGFIPDASQLFSAFDIYLATSIKEGLPYTILEAMASGTPLIATRIGGIPDVVTHMHSGHLIAPHSTEAVSDALIRLLEDDAYRTTLGTGARSDAARAYTRAHMAEQTFLLYQS